VDGLRLQDDRRSIDRRPTRTVKPRSGGNDEDIILPYESSFIRFFFFLLDITITTTTTTTKIKERSDDAPIGF
jgi:hypothetical protein